MLDMDELDSEKEMTIDKKFHEFEVFFLLLCVCLKHSQFAQYDFCHHGDTKWGKGCS